MRIGRGASNLAAVVSMAVIATGCGGGSVDGEASPTAISGGDTSTSEETPVVTMLGRTSETSWPASADFFERRTNTEARQRQLVRQLEALGHNVTLSPAA